MLCSPYRWASDASCVAIFCSQETQTEKRENNAEFNDFQVKYENCAKIWSNHIQENQTFEDIHQHIHQDVGITSLLSQQMTV